MAISVFDRGQQIKLTGTFTVDNVNTNPTTATLEIKLPDNSVVTKTGGDLTNEGTGIYSFEYTIANEGVHYFRWSGTGAVVAVTEGEFKARDGQFA